MPAGPRGRDRVRIRTRSRATGLTSLRGSRAGRRTRHPGRRARCIETSTGGIARRVPRLPAAPLRKGLRERRAPRPAKRRAAPYHCAASFR